MTARNKTLGMIKNHPNSVGTLVDRILVYHLLTYSVVFQTDQNIVFTVYVTMLAHQFVSLWKTQYGEQNFGSALKNELCGIVVTYLDS